MAGKWVTILGTLKHTAIGFTASLAIGRIAWKNCFRHAVDS
jgi:hypothetical protein